MHALVAHSKYGLLALIAPRIVALITRADSVAEDKSIRISDPDESVAWMLLLCDDKAVFAHVKVRASKALVTVTNDARVTKVARS
jgi:hypothetical protein